MDLLEENCINFTANTEEINVELASKSVGSPSISPVLNNTEIGVNNIDGLYPKSIRSSPNFNLDEEVDESSFNLGTNKEEDSGQTGFVSDSKLHLITEGSNERIKSPLISSKVINDEIGDNQNTNLDVNSKSVKGYGLKKWRRIRRDLSRSTSFDAAYLMILKRQHSHDEPHDFDKLVENRAFSVGAYPESNDDQSSKSSSMASVNKPAYEIGFVRDRSRIKNAGLRHRIKRGGGNVEILDSCISNEENKSTKNNERVPLSIDHFVDSITMLKAAQEALEAEIQNFGDISKSATEDNFDFNEQFEATEFDYSPKPDGHLYELNNKIKHLNYKLEAASAIIKAKEAKVTELENIMKVTIDTELVFEDLIKKKFEAEILYVIIDKYTRNWKILIEDQISTLFDEQTLMRLNNAEDKATELKGRAEELDCYCKELLGSGKVLKLKSKIHKISFCSFIQLIMLCFALGRFFVLLMPPYNEFVPT